MKNYQNIFKALSLPCLLLEHREGMIIITDVNDSFLENSGRKKEDLVGMQVPEVFPENPHQREGTQGTVLDTLENTFRSGERVVMESLRSDVLNEETGSFEERYWRVENIPLKDDGEMGCRFLLNIAVDTTPEVLEARRKISIEQELEERRTQSRHFIEKNPDGLFSLDREGNFLSVNEGLGNIAEIPEPELLKMNFMLLCAPHHKEMVSRDFRETLEGRNQQCEAEFISGKGKVKFLNISLVPMVLEGKIAGAYGIAHDISEKIHAETTIKEQQEALLLSERKHKALVEKASDVISILEPDGSYKFTSGSSDSVLGISPEKRRGRNVRDFIHPEDWEHFWNYFRSLEEEKQVKIPAFRVRDSEGRWRWFETIATNLTLEPSVQGIVTNSREVTEEIERTREIEELNERYRMVASATDDTIYEWDLLRDEVTILLDEENEELFGHGKDVINRRGFWRSHLHPKEKDTIIARLEQTIADPTKKKIDARYRFRRADGTYAHWRDRAYIVRDANGRATQLVGAKSDISEMVSKKNELSMANKRFSLAMKASNEMIWDWDISSDLINRGRLFHVLYGYDQSELPNMVDSWLTKISVEDQERVTASLEKALADPGVKKWKEEYSFIRKDGIKSYVIDRGYIVRDGRGKAVKMVGATLDVTDSRKLLAKVEEQNRILKEVAWEQSHVVRAPLVRLKGLLDLLEDENYGLWSRDELISHMNTSADELDEIIINIIKKTESIESVHKN